MRRVMQRMRDLVEDEVELGLEKRLELGAIGNALLQRSVAELA